MPRDDSLPAALSRRIDCARIVCIFGIVYAHVVPPWRLGQEVSSQGTKLLYLFLSQGVFHAGVPTLSVISGFLLFRAYDNSHYFRILIKKAGTLLIPAFAWSVATTVPAFLLQYSGLTQADTWRLYPPSAADWISAIAPFGARPINDPLYFIYDLYICIMLAPVILFFRRRARWLLLAVLVVGYFAKMDAVTGVRGDIILGFYIGCLLSGGGGRLGHLDEYIVPIGLVFLAACAADALVSMAHPMVGKTPLELENRFLLVRVLGPPTLWIVAGRLSVSRLSGVLVALAPMTFFIYCFHGPFIQTMSRLFYRVIYTGRSWEFEIFYFSVGALTIAAAIGCANLLARLSPYGLTVLSGRRLGGVRRLTAPRVPAVGRSDDATRDSGPR